MSENVVGLIEGTSGAGIATTHSTDTGRVVHVAPAVEDEHITLKATLLPVASCRIEDLRLAFDSSFVGPGIAEETALLASLIQTHSRDGEKPPLAIFGHADPVGIDDYNKQLSGRRAQAVYGLLTRDAGLWEELYSHPLGGDDWGMGAIQVMLVVVGHSPGVPDGKPGEQTTAAIEAFQHEAGLPVDGKAGPDTRERLFLAYMDRVCLDGDGNTFELDKGDFLAKGADDGGKGDYQGCGEFNPVFRLPLAEQQHLVQSGRRDERDLANAPNRRVTILLFPPGSEVEPDRWPCPRPSEGVAGCRQRFWSDGDERRSKPSANGLLDLTEANGTFACRFYDRITSRSLCETATNTLYRVLYSVVWIPHR